MSRLVILAPQLLPVHLRLDIFKRLDKYAAVFVFREQVPKFASVQYLQFAQCVASSKGMQVAPAMTLSIMVLSPPV